MVLTAASIVGRAHAHRGLQRQDAYGFKLVSDVLLCAIADGVSSAPFSGIAADVAVSVALSSAAVSIRDVPSDLERLRFAVLDAERAVQQLANDVLPGNELAGEQFASTLVLAAVRIDKRKGALRVSVISIGDSSALELTHDSEINVIAGPRSRGNPAELHDYLPRAGSKMLAEKCIVPARSTFLLVTDGLAEDMRSSQVVRNWVAEQLRTTANTVAAANILSYMRQSSGDDLTFLAVRPYPTVT